MFEEFIVGDLHALNLVDYLESTDFTHGGGGWWYGDLSIPSEYVASEKWYMWWHLIVGQTTGTSGLRIGFLPNQATVRSIRVAHMYSTSGATWIGYETYDPWYVSYDTTASSTQVITGECTILKRGTTWSRATFLSECHKRNSTNEYHDIQTNHGDASGLTWSTVNGLRVSCVGLPTSGTPIIGRVELYALAPRSLL